jgi:outer membrane protein
MNKLLSLLFTGALLSAGASADAFRMEAGGGAWMQKPSGSASYTTSTDYGADTSTEKEKTLGYAWVYLKHPIPILPNLRLEYSSQDYKGNVDVTVSAGGFTENTTSTSKLTANNYDAILYYNLLDNTLWTTLDLGLDVKVIDYKYDVAPTTTPLPYEGYSKSGTLVVPLAYLRARFQIPATGLGIEGIGSYITYSDVTVYDARIKADWTFESVPVVQPGIEVGYRIQKIKYDQNDKELNADVDFSGVYVGGMLRF